MAFASGLLKLGLDPADAFSLPPTPTCSRPEVAPVVVIQLPNCLAFATTALGTWAAGLTASLVSPALTAKELQWVLYNARPVCIITATACAGAMGEALRAQEDVEFFAKIPVYTVDVANDTYPAPQTQVADQDWKRLLASSGPVRREVSYDSKSRAAVILWSSGTSGRSKGVLLSHLALTSSAVVLWHDADYYQGRQQHWTGYVPFYHVFGLTNIFLPAICSGSTVYTMTAFKPETVLAAIARRGITFLHMAPPVAVMLAKSPLVEPYARRDKDGKNGFSTLHSAVTGGAPLGHEVIVQVYERLGFRIRLGYGLTETCGVTANRGRDKEAMESQKGQAGWPHCGNEVMIVANSEGKEMVAAPTGTQGEILIRSPALLMAYLPVGGRAAGANPDMSVTEEALTPDGWFRTGDVGVLAADGSLRITDRIKELIKVQGYQVAPAELEAVLCSSTSVADAGVVAVHDAAQATEWPRAYVVAAGGAGKSEEELRKLARELRDYVEKHTAKYKWLRGGIVFVDQIPKSPSGKILRRVLKEGGVQGLEVKVYEPKNRDTKL